MKIIVLIILWGTIAQNSKNRGTKFALGKIIPNMCEYEGKQPVSTEQSLLYS